MLTPQEASQKEFSTAAIGGYYKPAVDEFLQQLTQDYAALYKENTALKNKLKVLVDKVEEYRSTEDAMRMALLSAQKTAREITEKAEAESARLLAEAQAAAEGRKKELQKELAAEEAALKLAKEKTAAYILRLKAAAKEYESSVDRIYDFVEPIIQPDETAEETSAPALSAVSPATGAASGEDIDIIEETAKSIESSIAKIFEQAISSVDEPDAEASPAQEREAEKPAEPAPSKPKIDYSNLQFGSNYGKK